MLRSRRLIQKKKKMIIFLDDDDHDDDTGDGDLHPYLWVAHVLLLYATTGKLIVDFSRKCSCFVYATFLPNKDQQSPHACNRATDVRIDLLGKY